MKKILSVLLSFVLLMQCSPVAHMENAAGEAVFSLEIGETLMALVQDEMMNDGAALALKKVLEKAEWRVQTDEDDMYVQLLLSGTELADCRLHEQDGQVLLTSSLLPGVALRLPAEEKTDYAAVTDMIRTDVKAYLGEGEQGSFVLEEWGEEPFDTHYAIDLKDDALKQMVSNWVLTVDPDSWTDVFSVKPAYTAAEEEEYSLCDVYTRADGDFVLLLRDADGETCTDMLLSGVDGEYMFTLLPEQTDAESIVQNTASALDNGCDEGVLAVAEKLENSFNLFFGLYAGENQLDLQYSHEKLDGVWYGTLIAEGAGEEDYAGAVGDFAYDGEQVTGYFLVRYPEDKEFFTIRMSGRKSASPLMDVTYERVMDAMDLTSAQEEELRALVTGSAIRMFIYAAAVMPDEIAELTNYMVLMENDALGIIGGADGPTAIVITDQTDDGERTEEEPAEIPAEEPTERPTARPLFGQ